MAELSTGACTAPGDAACGNTGTLPDVWGLGAGMQTMRQLFLTGASLSGTLPAAWGAQLPSLWEVDFIACGMVGECSPQARGSSPVHGGANQLLQMHGCLGSLEKGWALQARAGWQEWFRVA